MMSTTVIDAAGRNLAKAPKSTKGDNIINIGGWSRLTILMACREAGMDYPEASDARVWKRVVARAKSIRAVGR